MTNPLLSFTGEGLCRASALTPDNTAYCLATIVPPDPDGEPFPGSDGYEWPMATDYAWFSLSFIGVNRVDLSGLRLHVLGLPWCLVSQNGTLALHGRLEAS